MTASADDEAATREYDPVAAHIGSFHVATFVVSFSPSLLFSHRQRAVA